MTIDPLFVDLYPGDRPVNWPVFAAAGAPWHGAIFKATQGTRYRYTRWLTGQVRAFRAAASERYGTELFDGFYHYLELDTDGAMQADCFVNVVEQCGGESRGTLWGMVDVERGGQRIKDPSRAQVEDCTRGFASRYEQLTGRTATLYGGELLRAVGVRDRLGCGRSALALYGATLPAALIHRTGTDLEHLMLWQYAAAEGKPTGPAGYPTEVPGGGRLDVSALVLPGGLERLRATLWAESPAT